MYDTSLPKKTLDTSLPYLRHLPYLLLVVGKVEDTNKIDSAAMLIYSFQNSNTITTYFTLFNSK